jgi:hypothetical protein
MANCVICGSYFKISELNYYSKYYCENCCETEEDEEAEIEISLIVNKSNKKKPVFIDEEISNLDSTENYHG